LLLFQLFHFVSINLTVLKFRKGLTLFFNIFLQQALKKQKDGICLIPSHILYPIVATVLIVAERIETIRL